MRRSITDPEDLAYYAYFGPAKVPLAELVRVAGTRWIISAPTTNSPWGCIVAISPLATAAVLSIYSKTKQKPSEGYSC